MDAGRRWLVAWRRCRRIVLSNSSDVRVSRSGTGGGFAERHIGVARLNRKNSATLASRGKYATLCAVRQIESLRFDKGEARLGIDNLLQLYRAFSQYDLTRRADMRFQ
jgi:hypothetical protein